MACDRRPRKRHRSRPTMPRGQMRIALRFKQAQSRSRAACSTDAIHATSPADARHPDPSWRAGQACSGGSAGLEPPDASGAILFSQQLRHSTCGRWCRPCSCSHATCAAPPTSSRSRPPPKRSPGTLGSRRSTALGIRRSTAVHLPIDKAARSRPIAQQAAKSSVTPQAGLKCRTTAPHSRKLTSDPGPIRRTGGHPAGMAV